MSRSAVRTLRQFSTDRFSVLLSIIAVSGTGLILVREINYGVGLGHDSVEYISLAKSLLEGEGFTRYYGGTLIRFPPLYPMMLAAASFFSFDPFDIAGPLNAILTGLTIFMVGRWLQQNLLSPLLALWGCVILMFSVPIAEIASRAMTEPAYILLMILALIQADNFIRKGANSSLIWSAIFTALACITRFTGIAIIAIVTLILLFSPNIAAKMKVKHIVIYSFISLAPVLVWMSRTYIISGKLAGNRNFKPPSRSVVLESFYEEVPLLYEEVLRQGDPIWPFLVVTPVLTIWALYRIRSSSDSSLEGSRWPTVFLFHGFLWMHIFVTFISLFTQIVGYETFQFPTSRYMLPTYIPLLIGGLLILDQVLSAWHSRLQWAIIAIFLFSLAYQMARSVNSIQAANDLGFGYNNRRWVESDALQYVRDARLTGTILSNYTGAIYVHTDSLDKHRFLPCQKSELRTVILKEASTTNTYILWFHDSIQACEEQGSYEIEDLLELPELETVALPADGVLMKLNQVNPGSEPYRLHRHNYESAMAGDLLARSVFDVYRTGDAIHYVKDPCRPQDTEPDFFLHLIPVYVSDLPAHRQRSGFDNLDFHFDDLTVKGLKFNEKCLTTIPLPDYDVARIRTGQWNPAENRNLWQEEVALQ